MTAPWRTELEGLARLAAPVVAIQLGLVAMGLVDTLLVGRVSAVALAGIALGHVYSFTVQSFGLGVLMALDPLVSQAVGARDSPAIARAVQRGFALALVLIVPSAILLGCAGPLLRALGQAPETAALAASYSHVVVLSVPAFYAFVVLRQTLQSMGHLREVLAAVVAANVVNGLLAYALIHGAWGAPRMGPIGTAWATAAARWVLMLSVAVAGWRLVGPHVRSRVGALTLGPIVAMARIGAPIGLQYVLEIGTFSAVALLMGVLGSTELASHQIAIVVASFTFMLPMGISSAAAVRVGHAVGRADDEAARRSARVALACGAVVMLFCATLFLAAPAWLASLFTDEPDVVDLTARLLRIAAVFQLFDGVQVVAIGVLRGVGDTRAPMLVNVLGFLLVALPLAAVLGMATPLGAEGLWWGLVAGLVVVAAVLLARVRWRLAGELRRIER